jgi:hypothetical protein
MFLLKSVLFFCFSDVQDFFRASSFVVRVNFLALVNALVPFSMLAQLFINMEELSKMIPDLTSQNSLREMVETLITTRDKGEGNKENKQPDNKKPVTDFALSVTKSKNSIESDGKESVGTRAKRKFLGSDLLDNFQRQKAKMEEQAEHKRKLSQGIVSSPKKDSFSRKEGLMSIRSNGSYYEESQIVTYDSS